MIAVTVGVGAGSVFVTVGKDVCVAGGTDMIAVAVTVGIGAGSVFSTAGMGVCIVGDAAIVGVVAPALQPNRKTLMKMQMAVQVLSISRNKDGSLFTEPVLANSSNTVYFSESS